MLYIVFKTGMARMTEWWLKFADSGKSVQSLFWILEFPRLSFPSMTHDKVLVDHLCEVRCAFSFKSVWHCVWIVRMDVSQEMSWRSDGVKVSNDVLFKRSGGCDTCVDDSRKIEDMISSSVHMHLCTHIYLRIRLLVMISTWANGECELMKMMRLKNTTVECDTDGCMGIYM